MDDLIIINRPIREVFAFVTGPIGVGTLFEVVTVSWNYRRAGEVEVLEYEPYRWYVYRSNAEILPFVAQLSFAPITSGTAIRGHVEFHSQGLWKLLAPLLLMFFRGQSKQTFAHLKQVMENTSEKQELT